MKTTIEIDRRLLRQAQKVLKTETLTNTIAESLKSVVRDQQLRALAGALGTVALDLTVPKLRRQRARRTPRVSD